MSGGHLTPALAVIHAFRAQDPKMRIVFVGREFAQEQERMPSREREEMQKLRIPFYSITAAKFHRTYFLRNIGEIFRLVPSLKQTYDIFLLEKPDILILFGGYLAVPLALVARMLRIPIITHEQTRTYGMANKAIAYLAEKVAVSSENSRKFFPREKVVVTGNPVRPAFMEQFRKKPEWLAATPINKPVIYVTGGSQGSHVLNQTLKTLIPDVTKHMIVIHQCGASAGSAYMHELEAARNQLPTQQQKRYVIREWVSEQDVAWLFQHVDLVIARSGANTVHEILVSKVPAIFIPLPFSHANEQYKNAQMLSATGAAVIIQQQDLIPKTLFDSIKKCLKRGDGMRKRAEELSHDSSVNAAEQIVSLAREVYAAHTS